MEEQCNSKQDNQSDDTQKEQPSLSLNISADLRPGTPLPPFENSEELVTTTVLDLKGSFDSDQSLCDSPKKLPSESRLSKKDAGGKSCMSAPSRPVESSTPRRLNKLRDHMSTVFPAGCMGCPEDPPGEQMISPRRFLDAMEAKEHAPGLIDNTPKKRPNSAKPGPFFRNPVTGVGVDVEEVKRSTKRRGGNPLLGEGYDCDIKQGSNTSNSRIPPGGYSKGLW